MRCLRHTISSKYRQSASQAVANHFIQNPLFKGSENIACYLATRNELNIQPIIQAIWQANKHCYLPVLSPTNVLNFKLYKETDELKPNNYGILEPFNTPLIATQELDLVLTPLLAFDLKGHRLGAGGGFYDRTFAFLLNSARNKPLLIGTAFELQKLESVPYDVFDVPLKMVLTEQGLIAF